MSILYLQAFAAAKDLPQLKLPWGTWKASVYPDDDKVRISNFPTGNTTNTASDLSLQGRPLWSKAPAIRRPFRS